MVVVDVLDGHFGAHGLETLEFLHGAAVEPLGLGLIAEEERPTVGLLGHEEDAFGGKVVAILVLRDFDAFAEVLVDDVVGIGVEIPHGFVEGAGEEAGFEAGGAEDGLLCDGHTLDGDEFLGIDGLVGGDEVGLEAGDFVEVFEADDIEGRGCEAVADGVAGRGGFAFWGARSGGMSSVGAVGGKLFGGDGLVGVFHDSRSSTEGGWSLKLAGVK